MKKSLASTLVLILFWFGIVSVVPVKASPAVLNVPAPFPTISAALAVAMPGDSIHVWNGPPIVDSPVVNVPNIQIIGQMIGGAFIQTATPGLPCFTINAPGVTVMKLSVMGLNVPGDMGFHITPAASNCKIIGNDIFSFDYGIVINNSPNNQIIGNLIYNCIARPGPPPGFSVAILIIGLGSTNNAIRGNEIGWGGAANNLGVEVNSAGGNTITFNNFWGSFNIPQAFVVPGAPAPNTWDSVALGKGNFWADPWPHPPYIIPIPPEVDTFCAPGPYNWAAMPWDLNRDCKCDIKDLATAAMAYGSFWSMPKWNPIADVAPQPNGDGKIDIKDLAFLALRFGWFDP